MPDPAADALAAFVPQRIPSASTAVLVRGRPALVALGDADRGPPPRAADVDTFYDLASLTKPLVTASVAAALCAEGLLDVDAPAAAWVPAAPPGVTVRHLLHHAAGYPAWAPLYAAVDPTSSDARPALIDAAVRTPLTAAPGARHLYSDLGFLTLLAVLESAGAARLDHLFRTRITDALPPLALSWGHPDAAATEDCPVRGHVVRGVVHDLNAWAMGGVSSHAGLFGTAAAVAHLAHALTDRDGPLPDVARTLHAWWSVPGPGSHRGGWDTPTPGGSTGGALPASAVGHLGYTGTSVWCLPDDDIVLVLLTNRVHPRDDLTAIKALRPAWHRAVMDAIGG